MTSYGNPVAPRSPATPEQRAQLMSYVAAALGVLSFVWGFLHWFTSDTGDVGGYSVFGGGAAASIALSLVAGALAAVRAVEKRAVSLEPVVFAAAGLLVVFAVLIGKSNGADGVGTGVGLILQLITAIVQVGVLVVGWMTATGRIAVARPTPPAQAHWQQPQGYQPPAPQQPQQPYAPPPPGYQPPSGYQQPTQQAGYQPPPPPPDQPQS